jgi:hypothetical protein
LLAMLILLCLYEQFEKLSLSCHDLCQIRWWRGRLLRTASLIWPEPFRSSMRSANHLKYMEDVHYNRLLLLPLSEVWCMELWRCGRCAYCVFWLVFLGSYLALGILRPRNILWWVDGKTFFGFAQDLWNSFISCRGGLFWLWCISCNSIRTMMSMHNEFEECIQFASISANQLNSHRW